MNTLTHQTNQRIAIETLKNHGFKFVTTESLLGIKKEIVRPINNMSFTDSTLDNIQLLRNDGWEF